MIVGIGTDMIEIERIKKACVKEAFLVRVYTAKECRQADGNMVKLAGNFAVKEAVAKALGTGFRTFKPIDIEVLRDDLGKPYVVLYNNAKNEFLQQGMTAIHVSISNTVDYAFGFAIGEGEKNEISGNRQTNEGN